MQVSERSSGSQQKDTHAHGKAGARVKGVSGESDTATAGNLPDEVEPDDPSLGGQELLGESDGDRTRNPHRLSERQY